MTFSLPTNTKKSKGVLQSSVSPNEYLEKHIAASANGLVWAAYYAYSDHRHLTLRPEDVWFAIISQLSFYIKAHAEEHRSMFVAHEGRKELVVYATGTIHTVDFGTIAKALTDLIQENVTRPDLQTWIMPDFSTTTESDRAVASVLFMGAMQKYFSYGACLACGIPSVTLLGEREVWKKILQRLDVLPEFGKEPAAFADGLRTVLQGFIATFDGERTAATLDFWGRIAHRISGGSGPEYLSEWITAFCFWDADGKPLLQRAWYARAGAPADKVVFEDIPSGYAAVPLTVNDNGKEYLTNMIAGSFGIEAFSQQKVAGSSAIETSSQQEAALVSNCDDITKKDGPESDTPNNDSVNAGIPDVVLDSVKLVTGWMMYHTKTKEDGHIENLRHAPWGLLTQEDQDLLRKHSGDV